MSGDRCHGEPRLTLRLEQVEALVGQRLTTKEVAAELVVSRWTAHDYVNAVIGHYRSCFGPDERIAGRRDVARLFEAHRARRPVVTPPGWAW